MTKTVMILAIAAAFVAGATVFGAISDYEAEAKPKKPQPLGCPPICPINATLALLTTYHDQLDEISESLDQVIIPKIDDTKGEYDNEQRVVALTELAGIIEAAQAIDLKALEGFNLLE